VSLVQLQRGKLCTKGLIRGNEKVVLGLTFSKMVKANTRKIGCLTMIEWSDSATWTNFPCRLVW